MQAPIDRSRGASPEPLRTGLIEADLQDAMVEYTGGWASDSRSPSERVREVLLSNVVSLGVVVALALAFMGMAVVLSR